MVDLGLLFVWEAADFLGPLLVLDLLPDLDLTDLLLLMYTAHSSGKTEKLDLPTPGGSLSTVLSISITSKSSAFWDFLLCTLLRLDKVFLLCTLDLPKFGFFCRTYWTWIFFRVDWAIVGREMPAVFDLLLLQAHLDLLGTFDFALLDFIRDAVFLLALFVLAGVLLTLPCLLIFKWDWGLPKMTQNILHFSKFEIQFC